MSPSAKPLFSADSIGKSFGGRVILRAASIWAFEGRITVLLGRNGCGKSTLLRIGAGLIRADQGAIHFAGRVTERPSLIALANEGLFYLPERGLFSRRMSVRDQLAAVAWRSGSSESGDVLERLRIQEVVSRPVALLSGGERRRAEIAAAVIRMPRCLLADEPLAGIHPADAEVVCDELRRLAAAGCAVVVTGHEVTHLLKLADDVVWMAACTTSGLGPPAQAAEHDQFRREYLGAYKPEGAPLRSS